MASASPDVHGSSYRPDIDGLRAIAITAVVLYHLGVPGFGGGFVGVDVFFVISGFLIGGIVFRSVASGSFGFARFYTRRARRILPALIAVTIASCAAGFFLLPPREYAHVAVSAASALAAVSNIRFWLAQGYFTQDPALDPFLMTWSLGVEEQFYLLLPPLLLLIRGVRRKHQLSLLWGVALVSLLLCIWLTRVSPDAAFYLIPTRAWELVAGVILALRQRGRVDVSGVRGSDLLAILAAAGMGVSVAVFSATTPFPGIAALLPVAATVAFILAEDSWLNRHVLSSRPFVGIGRISYSWYLWHWPILSYLRICSAGPPEPGAMWAAGLLSLGLGYVSWRFIEMPFRRSDAPQPRRELPRYGAAVAVTLGAALLIKFAGGVPSRVPPATVALEQALGANAADPCLAQGGQGLSDLPPSCRPGEAGVVLIGDSHAAALAPGLRSWAQARGLAFAQMTKTSCPPTLGLTRFLPRMRADASECANFNADVAKSLLLDRSAALIVMAADWSAPFNDAAAGARYEIVRGDGSLAPASEDALGSAVAATARRYRGAGKRIVVLGDVPSLRFDAARWATGATLPLRRLAIGILDPGLGTSGIANPSYIVPVNSAVERQVANGASSGGASYRSGANILCSGGFCLFALRSGMPLYSDTHHLSPAGAAFVVGRLKL